MFIFITRSLNGKIDPVHVSCTKTGLNTQALGIHLVRAPPWAGERIHSWTLNSNLFVP